MNLFEKFYMQEHMYLADTFEYHFTADHFKHRKSAEEYDLLSQAYKESAMQSYETYMEVLKKEEDFLVEQSSPELSEGFKIPFKNRDFFFGYNAPYMLIFLLI